MKASITKKFKKTTYFFFVEKRGTEKKECVWDVMKNKTNKTNR